ncbi:MAG TPA: C-terminal helicase domain-containing protein, partial [Candidatus Nanopelagicales bacterium]|nr:C-terminal helicase domain-containing protein [Candidatus Nanopelagicales bacterium]
MRGQVQDTSGTKLEQRVRWWSALSLLRSIASSPAAARATLATRSASASAESPKVADELGRSEVLDLAEDDALDSADAAPGAVAEADATTRTRHVLKQFEQRAADLESDPDSDAKLNLLVADLKKLLKGDASRAQGYHPIVFCRFIQTAHYVTAALRKAFPKVAVEVVTGELAADERSARVSELVARAEGGPKILVATDCLSEGVNLQEDFQAVVHYDLAWNPTRHEQREGRVDRFGQPSNVVRALLIYGEDNGIDGIILDVLLRKHEAIRKDLGISVAVPPQSDQVLAALLEGVLMRGASGDQLTLDLGVLPHAKELDDEWRSSAEEERRSRSRFAQATIHADDVQAAMDA